MFRSSWQFLSKHFELENGVKMAPKRRTFYFLSALIFNFYIHLYFLPRDCKVRADFMNFYTYMVTVDWYWAAVNRMKGKVANLNE